MEMFYKIVTNIFGSGAVILGLVTLFGNMFLKKKGSDVLLSTIRSMMGFALIDGGSAILCAAIAPLTQCIFEGLNTKGVLQQMFPAYTACSAAYSGKIEIVFLLAMGVNALLVRFTKFKGFALTVHLQLFVAATFITFLSLTGLSPVLIIAIAAVCAGIYNWAAVSISHYYMVKTDMTDEFGLFVFDNWGMVLADGISRILGKSKDAEDIEFPKALMWMKDTFAAITVTMLLAYLLFGMIAGVDFVQTLAGTQFWWLYLILEAISFSAGLAIILYGVKMFVAEIIPAFMGFTEKFLPEAVVGLDYPVVFQYAPTSLMFGFIANLFGSVLACILMGVLNLPVLVIPGIQGQFFLGAIVGIFGNRMGGIRTCVVSAFLYGFITLFLISWMAPSSGVLFDAGAFYESAENPMFAFLLQKLLLALGL